MIQISELAALFLWNPVFPVKPDQSLFHVLLLLSKHRLSVVPVTESFSSKVVGYVTEVINYFHNPHVSICTNSIINIKVDIIVYVAFSKSYTPTIERARVV